MRILICLLLMVAPCLAVERGPVTNLPLPRFVSMKTDEGNARRGPSLEHRIDWVYRHQNTPLMITAEFGHWRRIEDADGKGGWMHYSLLSGVRTVVVRADQAPLFKEPAVDAHMAAKASRGVIARLGACELDWCQVRTSGHKGWVAKSAVWGVTPDELRED